MKLNFIVVKFLAVSALFLGCRSATPSVKVGLRSSWAAPPLLVELLEAVTLDNPDSFFPFLDAVIETETGSLDTLAPEAVYNAVLQTAVSKGFLSQPGALAIAELNLALHSTTPKIEAFYQYYHDRFGGNTAGVAEKESCGSWVDWYGETVCDVDTLVRLAGRETLDTSEAPHIARSYPSRPKILPFDHIYPPPSRTLERPPHTAIFYASLTAANFPDLHRHLLSLANGPAPRVEYVFRHIPPRHRNDSERNYLSGYGVSLDLKNMEYLALDDRYTRRQESLEKTTSDDEEDAKETDPIVTLLKYYPESDTSEEYSLPLTQSEISEIGIQSLQLVLDSREPLDTLTYISQNFPKYATAIARRVIANESVMSEVLDNSIKAPHGANGFWLNGAQIEEKDISPLSLLRLIRKERALMLSLNSLGFTPSQALELLTDPGITGSQSDNGLLDGIFDASDRLEGGGVIIWWNDIEKDARYSRWNPSLFGLLQPTYPGQLPSVRHNLFNTVLVLDLSKTSSLNFIVGTVYSLIERNIPLRWGVVPMTKTPEGLKMGRLLYYMIHKFGRATAMAFLKQISQVQVPLHSQTPTVDWELLRSVFDEFIFVMKSADPMAVADLDSILSGSEETVVIDFNNVDAYTERLGINFANPGNGEVFVNGRYYEMEDNFLGHMQVEVGQQLQYLQQKIYMQDVTDEMAGNMSTYFYDLPITQSRRNRYIYPTTSLNGALRIVNLPNLFSRAGFHVSSFAFVYPHKHDTPLTLFLVADLDSKLGLDLVKEAITAIITSGQTRVSFIHNPSQPNGQCDDRRRPSWLLSQLMAANLLSKASPSDVLRAIGAHLNDSQQSVLSRDEVLELLFDAVPLSGFDEAIHEKYVKSSRLVARELGLAPGEQALIINGRVIGPLHGSSFKSADFEVLEAYEMRNRVESVIKVLERILSPEDDSRHSFAHIVSLTSLTIFSNQLPDPSETGLFDPTPKPRQRSYRLLSGNYTAFELGDESTALYHIAILLDPISEAAQKWSSLVKWLSSIPGVYVKCYLNPPKYTELSLKRFHRHHLLPRLLFDEEGKEVAAQTVFENLPLQPVYTLAMDVPSSWLVRPRDSLYDLDNIQLGSISPEEQSVEALFELDYLIIEGHARDARTGAPPRGLQLQLVDINSVPVGDTLVAANLGYLQFKSKPGVFQLEIRPGRGKGIYRMDSVGNEGWHSPTVEETGSEITLTDFEGLTLYPRLSRLPGMETEDVLADLHEPHRSDRPEGLFDTILSRITRLFGLPTMRRSDSQEVSPKVDQADINIFTVASGLLYERFVSIMILSVLRNTHSTVKFWFIENFLSPSFLEFIPHMAEAYQFQYELVTYKWPSWLRAQKEKQRIIWAYKILFLDVLFPMDLKKVIFVDADQIVRADLKELVDLDLRGAPYGYTPMGDDNEEMEGFRFWKTGYWKDFLRGRPYHISALYVIDLVRFRQIAAGDILRGQYQALSQDPNSLANLDQDLPNNLQREIPIFSLHEDWLWCETWCSKDRLHRAKTIDLCQNPLTKEPKLSRARRIPEWEEYDREIARFAQKLAENGLIRSRMAAADANVLAGGGTSAKIDVGTTQASERNPQSSTVHANIPDEL